MSPNWCTPVDHIRATTNEYVYNLTNITRLDERTNSFELDNNGIFVKNDGARKFVLCRTHEYKPK